MSLGLNAPGVAGVGGHRAAGRDPQRAASESGGACAPIDTVARRLWGVPVVLNWGLGDDVGLVIVQEAVTVDHDRQVEVKGQARKADTRDTCRGDTP